MTYPEEVGVQQERERILNLIDEAILVETNYLYMSSMAEYPRIHSAINTLQELKKKITDE